jgi:hypothetical protein
MDVAAVELFVHRRKKTANFLQIANWVTNDRRLTYSALGLLTHLLSQMPDRPVRVPSLVRRVPGQRGGGRDAVRSSLRLLRQLGYVSLVRLKKRDGTFETVYHVYEFPEDNRFTK